jgi:hypothetical protein
VELLLGGPAFIVLDRKAKKGERVKLDFLLGAFCVALSSLATQAQGDTFFYCKGDECVGRHEDHPDTYGRAPLGTYQNPIQDDFGGDLSGPVHRGMYCVRGVWHQGWLRSWERSPVIKPSCGAAVHQLPG